MQWISITELFPPYDYVLVWNGEYVFEAKIRCEDIFETPRFGFLEDKEIERITHWMPLPKGPNEADVL